VFTSGSVRAPDRSGSRLQKLCHRCRGKRVGELPAVMFAENYDLNLTDNAKATDVLLKLVKKTPLLDMMIHIHTSSLAQRGKSTPKSLLTNDIDRVIVHVEQMSVKNAQRKQFGIELGKLLQQQVSDPNKCIVKLSQPHLHRATGPMFRIGDKINKNLQLVAATYGRKSVVNKQPIVLLHTRSAKPLTSTTNNLSRCPQEKWTH
jgi:hypothetical protein